MTEQRREHVRVPAEMDLRLLRLQDEEDAGWLGTISLDVSGGGLKIPGPDALRVGDALRIELTLPDGERIVGKARVARVGSDPEHGTVQGVEMEAMPERDRDAIVKHVFDRQRELLSMRAEEQRAEEQRAAAEAPGAESEPGAASASAEASPAADAPPADGPPPRNADTPPAHTGDALPAHTADAPPAHTADAPPEAHS